MAKPLDAILGIKIGSTRIVPLVLKIVLLFSVFLLVSNLTTNYINLMFNRTELVKLMKELLVKDLKELYTFSNNQFEITEFTRDVQKSVANIEDAAFGELKNQKAVAMGIKPDASVFFQASRIPRATQFPDATAVKTMKEGLGRGVTEGVLSFFIGREEYFGVYKYNSKWDLFILRGEELQEFYADSRRIFGNVSLIIAGFTLVCSLAGIFFIRFVLRYVGLVTAAIMKMRQQQEMELINLEGAPNDEVTFLGVAFNALSSMINNLLTIFRKFVSHDIALKAYRERVIRLEGARVQLTVLFSDIKSFTYMTETLGTDIIRLLNSHYERAIRSIVHHDGIVGSLIGDALLAVFGTIGDQQSNKSLAAIRAAYEIQENASQLRMRMMEKREEIVRERGALTPEEEAVYRAVLVEVGVGIDGGDVFYGNIGSEDRMTNTVIGDNVNAASRLEGLTRIYMVPVICSDYVKEDIQANVGGHGIHFVEIDQVQVKGKTTGKRVYWAIPDENVTSALERELDRFSTGLALYYVGSWEEAYRHFSDCTLPLAEVFKARTKDSTPPPDWNGIWAMTTK